MELSEREAIRIAGLELNTLNFAQVLPRSIERTSIEDGGTLVYDISGKPLFRRIRLIRGNRTAGYADIGVNDIFGEPLLAVQPGEMWNEANLLRAARVALRKRNRQATYDAVRFVAYSFPKLAVQFLNGDKEVAMLELYSWAEVPPARDRHRGEGPGNFERWSLIEETPDEARRENAADFKKRVDHWQMDRLRTIDPTRISLKTIEILDVKLLLSDTREVHYAPRAADHHICYELRGQQTPVWCVAASVEMILNFYRWRYDQPRIARELDLGTCTAPNGLPYGDEIKVVNTLEALTRNSLDASMTATPGWTLHRDSIRDHRPLISFVPGHSRTVAGYTESRIFILGELPYRGLLVYDPWPPTDCYHPEEGGRITRWENFRTTTYRYAFTSSLRHV
jgi:hypothetical protein